LIQIIPSTVAVANLVFDVATRRHVVQRGVAMTRSGFWGLLLVLGGVLGAHAQPLWVGITPLKPAAKLAEEWTPLLDQVARRSGVELRFRTATSIPAFGERLEKGEYDIAYMNPYHYQVVSASPGYRAFARERNQPLEGILIVRKDSKIKSLRDINGAKVSFPTPLAFAASMLTQAELHAQGIQVHAQYVQSHDSVLKSVAGGHFEVGGTILKVLQTADPQLGGSLRVLHTTAVYHSHPFGAHPRVPAGTVQKLQQAFSSLQQDEVGRKLLATVAFKGFEPAIDSDYNDVRRLDLKKLIESVQ
jgi:phosphonate transport system substrate-binding protein